MRKIIIILLTLILSAIVFAQPPPPPPAPADPGAASPTSTQELTDLPPEPEPITAAQQDQQTTGLPAPPPAPAAPGGTEPEEREAAEFYEESPGINYPLLIGLGVFVVVAAAVIFYLLKNKGAAAKKTAPKPVQPSQLQQSVPQIAQPNPQLVNYIRSVLNMGYTQEQIKQNLINYGYREEDINICLNQIQRGY
ncbi:hypothetical protein KY345_04090 [Candidatus Woesearchaeota archaeon]|nr:hypothetical protein [Candidatus Woesearchaeota archaeon]